MKKYLFLLLALGFMVSCNKTKAQTSGSVLMYKTTTGNYSSSITQVTDTITNAATTYAVNKTTLLSSVVPNYALTFTATNISGTSTFKVVILGSMNGIDWYPATGVPGTDGRNCDTLQCTSVTTAKQFVITMRAGAAKSIPAYHATLPFFNTANRWKYLRSAWIGTGTQSTKIENPTITTSN